MYQYLTTLKRAARSHGGDATVFHDIDSSLDSGNGANSSSMFFGRLSFDEHLSENTLMLSLFGIGANLNLAVLKKNER